MSAIPSACFSDQWMKQAKVKGSSDVTATSLGNKLIKTMRYGSLISQCYKLCEFAKKNGECFENTMSSIARAIIAAMTYDDSNRHAKRKFGDIKDPDIVKTKGTAANNGNERMRKRKCGICREEGHTRATCPSIKAIRRRFDKRIYIPLPDAKARQYMFKVKDVLFEPVRKTQDAMYFFKTPTGMWVPCGPKQVGALQMTTQDLATTGEAAKV
ncbi:Protein SUPPRESSOR OF K(+) TRANSPORT GROWTH DEFECT 1 [Linum perenne]